MTEEVKEEREIRLSVALVTRNRADSLRLALQSLQQQETPPWEVVISDDSDDETMAQTQELAEQFGFRYVRGPRRGLYANRNHAAVACRGTHIHTMDDDHELLPDHFAHCLRALESDKTAIWTIGEYHHDKPVKVAPPPCPGQQHARGFSTTPPDPQNCWAIADGSTIFPRTIFDSGIRYVEAWKFGSAFLELGSRLYARGYRVRFVTTTYIIHRHSVSESSGTVWMQDNETALASRYFSAFRHAWLYQPSWRNKGLFCAQVFWEVCRDRSKWKALRIAFKVNRELGNRF